MVIFRKPRSAGGTGEEGGQNGGGIDWPIYVFIAAAFAFAFLHLPVGERTTDLLLRNPDNNMRLVEVRDFLAGQSWWDVSQYRMGFGEHGNMHWSRLADIPLIVLITVFSWFVAPDRAEAWAVAIEPPLFLIPALIFLAVAAGNIARPGAGSAARAVTRVVAILTPLFATQFAPGRIDHHHLQLTLLAGALAALTGRESFRNGALAGAAVALSLTIGLETAPLLAVGAAALAIRWAVAGEEMAAMLRGFLLGLPLAVILFTALSVPSQEWWRATYDQLGRGHLTAIGLGTLTLALLMRLRAGTIAGRLAQLAGAGLAAALALLVAPELLSEPYDALDPALYALWMDNIRETASIADTWRDDRAGLPIYFAFLIAALLAGAVLLAKAPNRETNRARMAIPFAMLAAGSVLTMYQVRAVPGASAMGIVIAAAAIAQAWQARDRRHGRAILAVAVLTLNGLFGLALQWLYVRTLPPAEARLAEENTEIGIADCEAAMLSADLDRFPPGLVLTGLDTGPVVLMRSHHSALSAGYHRNISGTSLAFRALLAPADEARAMLTRAGVDYVLYCPSLDFGGFTQATAQSLGTRLDKGDAPGWLELLQGGAKAGYAFYAVR